MGITQKQIFIFFKWDIFLLILIGAPLFCQAVAILFSPENYRWSSFLVGLAGAFLFGFAMVYYAAKVNCNYAIIIKFILKIEFEITNKNIGSLRDKLIEHLSQLEDGKYDLIIVKK